MTKNTAILEQYEMTDLAEAGAHANERAAARAFADYRSRKAQNTLTRQDAELARFGEYVRRADLAADPAAWRGITWGIVDAYVKQMVIDGYALGTVNCALSTIKTYAELAAKAGVIASNEFAMIATVTGYGHTEGRRVDEKREAAGLDTRRGDKKGDFAILTEAQEAAMLALCDTETAQGRRDRALLVLLLDLGLRVGEAAALKTGDFEPESGRLIVNRPKTSTVTRFTLRNGKLTAMAAYFEFDALPDPDAQLIRGSRKGGALTATMSERAMFSRVRAMGAAVGIPDLSPHDLRHTRATRLAAQMNVRQLMDFFGWKSPAMAARYIESQTTITVE